MAIRNAYPVPFVPEGITDAGDMDNSFPGACSSLQNLMFDPSNSKSVVGRPGVGLPITEFAGFTSPTFVSLQGVIGTYVFGMVSTGRTAGYDEPFCYDLINNVFVTISGVTSSNVPASLPTSGAWTPPAMAVIGTKIVITHTGFSGTGSNFFGVIDISTPSTPAWSANNVGTYALTAVPSFVANFNNRAYFVIKNQLWYTDVLNPLNATNANQALTLGDNTTITALDGLPITTTSAGVLGALIVFKPSQIWQVTGDATTLAQNFMSLSIGTSAPRSVSHTRDGTIFMGPDGHYLVNLYGLILPLAAGQAQFQDLRIPFTNATTPSRVASAYCGLVYRTSLKTTLYSIAVNYDYWFDTRKMRWCGPHTFPYDCASAWGENTILSGSQYGAKLFLSSVNDTQADITYSDNGVTEVFELVSAALPSQRHMQVKQVVETMGELNSKSSNTFAITIYNESNAILATAQVKTLANTGTWGASFWGSFNWESQIRVEPPYSIDWNQPAVFNKMYFSVSSSSGVDVSIGPFFFRYQDTGYLSEN